MLAKTPLCILGFAVSGKASQDCGEVQWRMVKPSEAGPSSANTTDADAPHFVTAQPTAGATDLLRVFLPGTFTNPGECTYLLRALASCNRPAIGLSYNFIPNPDGARNNLCFQEHGGDANALGQCLSRQHADGLFGSDVGKFDLWPEIAPQDSVTGRLTQLLAHLEGQFPEEGWARFRDGGAPRWDRILVAGHSQGAGHTGYLARTTRLAGAALISGPQDECQGCAAGPDGLWLAQPWATRHVTAVRHADESAGGVISENWRRMASTLGWPAAPTDVGESALAPPPYGAAVTRAPPAPTYSGVRPPHVSMAADNATPMTTHEGRAAALYELALWPALFADPPAAHASVVV